MERLILKLLQMVILITLLLRFRYHRNGGINKCYAHIVNME